MNRDDEIFAAALELPVATRTAWLANACAGDAALQSRIEALLAGHSAAADFLERPLVERPVLPEEKPGDRIGRYTLVRKIGDGGCGVVHLAEQHEPVRRTVALKVIKLGMDTREVIARFEAERQALAMMDHPDIARVFDEGATATGRPYFVMEFVDGVPITRYCDEHRLPVAARLELFARVCRALQHAHQKGIIHRDLKPSNILVAEHDGVPAPKVIDFGIAKATQGRLTEHTLVTGLAQLIGTPAYMSPEQAEWRDLDIDTRSDVYSLGVLLYELLAGRTPFDPRELATGGVDGIRRHLREVEPARPSVRIATLSGEDRAEVARLRSTTPFPLPAVVRGDLDWIVMRCLEKDRARRYASAQELADDVQRYLRQEPIVARPPTAAYRLQKFYARNRLACLSTAAVALALVLGTIISVRQAVRATRAERVAQAERDMANAAGRAEALARADAQRRQEEAENLLTFMLGDFRTELQKIGRLSLLDRVGEQAMAYFAALNPRDLTDTALARQARALTQIGQIRLDEARYPEASAAFQTAYDRAAALAARHPQDADMLFERAQAEFWLGYTARQRGETDTQREWLVRYRDSALALAAIDHDKLRAQREVTSGHHNLAVLELERGNLAAASDGFRAETASIESMLAAKPGDPQLRGRLADVASWRGTVDERGGELATALAQFDEMSARYGELTQADPAVARWQLELARSLVFAGDAEGVLGRPADAAMRYERADSLLNQLVRQDPKNRSWLISLLNVGLQRATLLAATRRWEEAAALLNDTRPKLEAVVQAEPSAQTFSRLLATAWRLEARLRLARRQVDASDAIARAIALGEPLITGSHPDERSLAELAQSCVLAGRVAAAAGRGDDARRDWQRALVLLSPHLPGSRDWRLLDPAAQALNLLGRDAEAQPLIEQLRRSGYHTLDPFAAGVPTL